MIWRVREPFCSFSMSPSIEAPSRVRPRAAVAMGSRVWIFRARSTRSRPGDGHGLDIAVRRHCSYDFICH